MSLSPSLSLQHNMTRLPRWGLHDSSVGRSTLSQNADRNPQSENDVTLSPPHVPLEICEAIIDQFRSLEFGGPHKDASGLRVRMQGFVILQPSRYLVLEDSRQSSPRRPHPICHRQQPVHCRQHRKAQDRGLINSPAPVLPTIWQAVPHGPRLRSRIRILELCIFNLSKYAWQIYHRCSAHFPPISELRLHQVTLDTPTDLCRLVWAFPHIESPKLCNIHFRQVIGVEVEEKFRALCEARNPSRCIRWVDLRMCRIVS
ncbi:hypothetical protein BD414DRAFT_498410 [Trametes punicea]|nr:hypothetical protein BD414DRAFT_498410 [Trametes punicea]